jgi:hypothetical protein
MTGGRVGSPSRLRSLAAAEYGYGKNLTDLQSVLLFQGF